MSESTPTNLDFFLSIIKGVSEKTHNPIPPHLEILAGDNNLQKPEDLEKAIKSAGQSFEGPQCACLFANILNLCIKDGRLAERSFISSSRDNLRLERSDARDLEEVIEACFQTDRIFRDEDEWAAFSAGLIAIAEADDETATPEDAYLKRIIKDHNHIEAGRALLEGDDEINAKLARLSSRQKKCLAAHAMSIMLIDGDWKGSEQETLESLNTKMHLADVDAEKIMKAIHALYNVSVFA
tara:strand:+ start:1455 stop:2171 length:717 start_codon:yes stop_codon:yes gene_type:complete